MKTIIYNIGTLAGILPEGIQKLDGAQMNQVECIRMHTWSSRTGLLLNLAVVRVMVLKTTPPQDIQNAPMPLNT